MEKPKIGLLPLYLELYDKTSPRKRPEAERFAASIADMLSSEGIRVIRAPACRLKQEFKQEITGFKKEDVDAIVTLHLAYSPSLESSESLSEAGLPVIIFDTTPDSKFGYSRDPGRIMFNHGIHGVQDMCNMLVRNKAAFSIVAGHWKNAEAVNRLLQNIYSAKISASFRKSRTGIIGRPFKGMGDFQVPSGELKKMGITVFKAEQDELNALSGSITKREIVEEINRDKKLFYIKKLNPELHKNTIRACLAVRKWAEKNKLSAFTMNFMDIDKSFLPTVPFLEASKLMARGLGYAGEGDILTASLAGALSSVNKQTTFTEMFCPDWEGGEIFMSHMGEVNHSILHDRAELIEKDFPYADIENPVTATGKLKSGRAHIVNLAPVDKGKYRLLICPGSVPSAKGKNRMAGTVHGWFRPKLPLNTFLELYSKQGGTHHSVLAYDGDARMFTTFGEFMGWETVTIC